nr:putative no exine formation 1 [Tanacetum cinerariifolium]
MYPKNMPAAEDHKVSIFYCTPLQEFTPNARRYPFIWIQWCIGKLVDDYFVSYSIEQSYVDLFGEEAEEKKAAKESAAAVKASGKKKECMISAKRSLVLVITTSLNFIVMQLPLPSSWTYHSELIRAARQVRMKTVLAESGVRDLALEIKFALASLMREKVNERGGLRHSQSGQSSNSNATIPPKMRFMQQRRVSTMLAFIIRRIAAEGAWMPVVGNVATIMCFAICLILNVNLTCGSNRAIFFLAPILLS